MCVERVLCPLAASVAQAGEEIPVGFEFARDADSISHRRPRSCGSACAGETIDTVPSSISRVTKLITRISRSSEELKLISLTWLRISSRSAAVSPSASG